MRYIYTILLVATLLFISTDKAISQTFWTETFGTECMSGTPAHNYITDNGTWKVDAPTSGNQSSANKWYISGMESGAGVGRCGRSCGLDPKPTLHISKNAADEGANYRRTGDAQTETMAMSPVIDCSGQSNIKLYFEYVEGGDDDKDNLTIWYNDGTTWSMLEDSPETPVGDCFPSSFWSSRIIDLPASADNNPNVQIGFKWENDDNSDGSGFSAAIYNIQLKQTTDVTPPDITCVDEVDLYVDDNCEVPTPLFDAAPEVVVSDDQTAVGDLVITQNIDPGSALFGPHYHHYNVDVIVTVQDEAGNTNSCTIQVNLLDTVSPKIDCQDFDVSTDELCNYEVEDFREVMDISDNCRLVSQLTYSQTPTIGTMLSGVGTTQAVVIDLMDNQGNTKHCELEITLIDDTPPAITCPSDETVDADQDCGFEVVDYTSLATISDNCSSVGDLVLSQDVAAGTILNLGTTVITLTAEDESGNVGSCSFEIAVEDNAAPVINNCVPDQIAYSDENCDAELDDYTALIDVEDNCTDLGDLVITQSPLAGTPLASTTNVTITIEDEAGNDVSCTFSVSIADTTRPVVVCPGVQKIVVDANCEYQAPDLTGMVTGTDNCSDFANMVVTQDISVGTTLVGNQVIVMSLTDEEGNVNTCEVQVEGIDQTAPTITCPSNLTESADNSCGFVLDDYTTQVTVSDNCTSVGDIVITQSQASGSSIGQGITTITLTAEDEAGNSNTCNFTVEVIDDTPPIITTCVPDQVAYANQNCETILKDYRSQLVVSDNCDASFELTITQTPAAGTMINSANSNIVLTVVDTKGNQSSCNFNVQLKDTISPKIICPSDSIVPVTVDCYYPIPDFTGLATGSDNCSSFSNMTVTQSMVPGTIKSGIQNVVLTLTDEAGNTKTCTVQTSALDVINPSITCPSNQTVYANNNCGFSMIDYTSLAVVNDNCSAVSNLVIIQDIAVGSVINGGLNTIQLTVEDESGNTATCEFDINVLDTISPTIICPSAPVEVDVVSDCDYAIPDLSGEVTISDNCSSISNMTITQNIAIGDLVSGNKTVIITVEDESGNTKSCSLQTIPNDVIAPSIICPSDVNVYSDNDCSYLVQDFTGLATVSDNCSSALHLSTTQDIAPGTVVSSGQISIRLTVTDASGNEGQCDFELIVIDTISPTIICPSDITTCTSLVTYNDPIVTEECSGFSVTQIDGTGYTSGSNFPAGVTIQEYEVLDAAGNSAKCSFTVEVLTLASANIITGDQELCDITNTELEAATIQDGNGTWIVEKGNASISNPNDYTIQVTDLSYGLNTFVWFVQSPICGFTSDTVHITVYEMPAQAKVLTPILNLCSGSSINISAESPTAGSGYWTSNYGVEFLDSTKVNTVASNLGEGWNDIYWIVGNGVCPTTIDTLHIYTKEYSNILTADTSVCLPNFKFELNSSAFSAGTTGYWYSDNKDIEIVNSTTPTPYIEEILGGENRIILGINHPVCGLTTDTLIIFGEKCGEYEFDIPTMFTPNGDGRNDLFVIPNLHTLYPKAKVNIVNRWGNLVFESEGYEVPWDGTIMNEGKEVPMGTYFYRIIPDDAGTSEISGSISIIR